MKEMVNGLLNLSRVKSHAKPFTEVELTKVARDVEQDLDALFKKTNGRLTIRPLPVITGDPAQIHQLLLNLISNALKYHRPECPPEVVLTSEKGPGDHVTLICSDNGIGFDEKHIDKIFLPFQRLSGKSGVEGSGIGLAICRRIVEHHNGSITASSKPDEGTTFIVTLPIKQNN